ncbi:MAG TPA: hydrogenase assembly protein HupF [Candidatus Methanomethylia archaeon]|nr:hydrogenase assembly protein HupF [Candidatus Methanomethylicia archaeon]
MPGKIPPSILANYIFARLGARDSSVIIGPSIGEDAAVLDLGDGKALVVHTDPISGAVEHLGWLAVHVASNDIAVTGAKPKWMLSVLFLPESFSLEMLDRVTGQMDDAAKELGISIVGGHSEYTGGIDRPLAAVTVMGLASMEHVVQTGGAKPGDLILMTKTAGVEGTAILATDFRELLEEKGVPSRLIRSGARFLRKISVVGEALTLAERRLAHAMHDATEGGILGGLAEVAYASGVSLKIYEKKIPVAEETEAFCNALSIDPLRLISSGVLLAAIPQNCVEKAAAALRDIDVEVSVIGEALENRGYLVELQRKEGGIERLERPYVEDELFKLWS